MEVGLDIQGKRILVIGGAGLIGSHVVEELLKEDVKGARSMGRTHTGKCRTGMESSGGLRGSP